LLKTRKESFWIYFKQCCFTDSRNCAQRIARLRRRNKKENN